MSKDDLKTDRRGVLGGLAFGIGAAALTGTAQAAAVDKPVDKPGHKSVDAALAHHIDTIVVIYAENRSFNNLFADFPGLAEPLSGVSPERAAQRDRDGSVMPHLPPVWDGIVPAEQVVEHRTHVIGEDDLPQLSNGPFALSTLAGDPLPTGVVTRDLVHRFYENQMQINGGRNDGFAAWGDSGGLVMGYYAQTRRDLRLWQLAREFTLCDRFFMGVFGGSFVNHQYLVAAAPPVYPHADTSIARDMIAQTDDGPGGVRLKRTPECKASAIDGPAVFVPSTIAPPAPGYPEFAVVNTMMPPFQPSPSSDVMKPGWALASDANVLMPQTHDTIGSKLDKAGVAWAWYSGGWAATLAGMMTDGQYPPAPNFQYHHQPFNYFAALAPDTPQRDLRLRDAGVGDTARTNHLIADAAAGTLPAVTFYKPQGNLNMHAGYSDVDSGDRHIAAVVDALRSGPQWDRMVIVITFDENGGWWDHVAPPKGDRWGPGTRVPTLVISPFAKKGHVDHTTYDTGSILRLITRRFGLEKLDGLALRDKAMVEAGGPAPGDLTGALDLA
ncbi:acid phosphatase [Novosphingobium sp.]|uniref:acid phosphatase n=1 Tax=Novosphingobium sp. TaxID=1874826 RepID=UPI003D0A3108